MVSNTQPLMTIEGTNTGRDRYTGSEDSIKGLSSVLCMRFSRSSWLVLKERELKFSMIGGLIRRSSEVRLTLKAK